MFEHAVDFAKLRDDLICAFVSHLLNLEFPLLFSLDGAGLLLLGPLLKSLLKLVNALLKSPPGRVQYNLKTSFNTDLYNYFFHHAFALVAI